eukprot:Phypoly_transcript_01474.p1 GENE.Phypoly_transcript_01474~~Phypoly_transcript_01474.p1  ORF type:complete len:947 (+),score=238.69 Phypoly_transcript_01474:130-2970(+)
MERANGTSSSMAEEGADDSEKPPPWEASDLTDDPTLSKEMQEYLENEDAALISREEIESSLKKYEELSRQLNETKKSLEHYENENRDKELSPDRLEEERESTDGEGDFNKPLSSTFDHATTHISEEERYKSDGEADEIMHEIMHDPIQEEERSKSDGDKDELEEDDDDAVPLRIRGALKSNKLSLSNCWLKTIPSEVWDLTHLTELDLSANYLKKISKSIGNLTSLKRLRLNHNQLSVLPKEMWSLTKLTTLLLNNNNIKMIPKEIKNLIKLKTLDLSSNQLNEIPVKEGIMQITSLVELRLRNNLITTLPSGMSEMTQLQVLWLEGNPVTVPKSVLKRSAGAILSYVKEHPHAKRPSIDLGNPRVLRKSPPSTTPAVNSHGHVAAGKKDFGILAEKELKKRKREQLEEMKKHLEVEKKVKHLEHELMLANQKAMKFEEEAARKVDPQPDTPTPATPTTPGASEPPPQAQPPGGPPAAFPQVQFGAIPPHMPRQQGQMAVQPLHNDYKPYPPVPPLVQQQQQAQQQQQQQQNQQPPQNQPNNAQQATNLNRPPSPHGTQVFEWEIPLMELSFGPRIGRGGYGEVYRGMWGGTEVAVKMLFTDNMNAKLLSDLRKEVDLLCKLRHPNILLFMGACTEPVTPCIVTEFLGRGSLASILMDSAVVMDWGLTLQVGIDCARGMAYLHSRNPVIIHRDLKTDNLLVDDNWQVKVADFGLATVKSRTFAKTMCGTTGWVAPEVLAEQGYTEKADVYSFAIILWELLTRQIPYAGKNTMQVVRSVDRGERLQIPPTCPPDYAKLINHCWDTDPSARPPFTSILVTLERMRAEYLAQKAQESSAPVTPRSPGNDNNGKNETTATKDLGSMDIATPPPPPPSTPTPADGPTPMAITPKNLKPDPAPGTPLHLPPTTPSPQASPDTPSASPRLPPTDSPPPAQDTPSRLIEDTSFT